MGGHPASVRDLSAASVADDGAAGLRDLRERTLISWWPSISEDQLRGGMSA